MINKTLKEYTFLTLQTTKNQMSDEFISEIMTLFFDKLKELVHFQDLRFNKI